MSGAQDMRALIGRKIVAVRLNPFTARPGTGDPDKAHAPEIELDNGRVIRFVVEETEIGEYGVLPVYTRPAKKPPGAARRKRISLSENCPLCHHAAHGSGLCDQDLDAPIHGGMTCSCKGNR